MRSRHKKKALIGLGISVPLLLCGVVLILTWLTDPWSATHLTTPAVIVLGMMVVSLPFYLWGCAELAQAKGYSTAILLTFPLGWVCPLLLLLLLRDKNRHNGRCCA